MTIPILILALMAILTPVAMLVITPVAMVIVVAVVPVIPILPMSIHPTAGNTPSRKLALRGPRAWAMCFCNKYFIWGMRKATFGCTMLVLEKVDPCLS
jgi:hypothetical protein